MAGWMTIELKGLRFFAKHGMYAEERKVGNEFEVDAAITYKAPKKAIHAIDETVNYVEVYHIIEEQFAVHHHLLETCVMTICDKLNERFTGLRSISVSVKKINPPITNFTGSVGVMYFREFK